MVILVCKSVETIKISGEIKHYCKFLQFVVRCYQRCYQSKNYKQSQSIKLEKETKRGIEFFVFFKSKSDTFPQFEICRRQR